jgi:hypothetical protein
MDGSLSVKIAFIDYDLASKDLGDIDQGYSLYVEIPLC